MRGQLKLSRPCPHSVFCSWIFVLNQYCCHFYRERCLSKLSDRKKDEQECIEPLFDQGINSWRNTETSIVTVMNFVGEVFITSYRLSRAEHAAFFRQRGLNVDLKFFQHEPLNPVFIRSKVSSDYKCDGWSFKAVNHESYAKHKLPCWCIRKAHKCLCFAESWLADDMYAQQVWSTRANVFRILDLYQIDRHGLFCPPKQPIFS